MNRTFASKLIYVLFQTNSLANGGLESATQLMARLPFKPVVVTQRESDYTRRWRKIGSSVHVWPVDSSADVRFISRIRRASLASAFNWRVSSLVRRTHATVVQCNDIAAFWYAGPGAKAGGARVVFNVRDVFPEERPYGPRWRAVHHIADEIVCLSEDMRRTVLERFPPLWGSAASNARVSVIYSAVDFERMRALDPAERAARRSDLGLADDRFEIAYVGTICDKKDQLGFITRALPALVARVPATRVTFVGDFHPEHDPYAASCQEAVTRLGLEGHVSFTGYVSHPECYYQSADLVCLASKYEGLPRAMIESMACGTPVVAFDVTSTREFLERHSAGLVARRGDWHGLVEALNACAIDRAYREAMGRNARQAAEKYFSPAAVAAAYVDRYENAGDG